MLHFLDVLLTIVHLAIVGFNLFGWIPKATRKTHLILILCTAASWFLLGIWFGFGYCPFTDWQWRVKEELGERNLPSNFIEYFAEKVTGKDFDAQLVNNVIGICFALVSIISIYLNFFKTGKQNKTVSS
ncbi:MAG TPA: DUF2784 domain-containing protein [Flavitalea sp.]|nr:DUF2784 domain-containing protein [Flavitalea sp.]